MPASIESLFSSNCRIFAQTEVEACSPRVSAPKVPWDEVVISGDIKIKHDETFIFLIMPH